MLRWFGQIERTEDQMERIVRSNGERCEVERKV